MKTWLITGASSGLGRALAEHVAASGDRIIAAARSLDAMADLVASHPHTVTSVQLDVTDQAAIDVAVAHADEFGGIDVLVNNAGYGYYAAVEEGEPDAMDRLFATNFFGPAALIRRALPGMRRRGSGTIINVTSAGARLPMPSGGYYSASKAALEALSGSLRREVAGFGLHVMVVEPGTFRTAFRGRGADRARATIEAYDKVLGRTGDSQALAPQLGDPARGAAAIVEAVGADDPPHLLLLGSDSFAGFRTAAADEARDVERMEQLTLSTDAHS